MASSPKREYPGYKGNATLDGPPEAKPEPARIRGPVETIVPVPPKKITNTKGPGRKFQRLTSKNYKGYVAKWLETRIAEPKITQAEMARRLNIDAATLARAIKAGINEGWLKFDEAMDRMRFEVVPKTLDGLVELLDQKDKKAIIETAKGAIFPIWQAAEGVANESALVLGIRIEYPEGHTQAPQVIEGQIVGKPKELKDVAQS